MNNWKFLASGSVLLAYAKELVVLVQILAERVHVINDIIWQIFAIVWAEGPRTNLAQKPMLSLITEMFSLDKGWGIHMDQEKSLPVLLY